MKKNIFSFLLFFFCFFACALQAEIKIPEVPSPIHYVNDYSQALSLEEKQSLEGILRKYYDTTSTQLIVVVIPSTEDYTMAEYGAALGRKWGVGQKDKKNGVIILWATQDRKIFISTGYGMEGVLPDATCKAIVNNEITPYFKKGRYYEGLVRGIYSIIHAARGEYKLVHKPTSSKQQEEASPFVIVIILAVIAILLFTKFGRTILFGMFLSSLFRGGGSTISSGGSWGGGGSGSGGSSFGGGDFGGGGAGGSY